MKKDKDKLRDYESAIRCALRLINEQQNVHLDGGRPKWLQMSCNLIDELQWALDVNDAPPEDDE